jgi:hypothetical protein
MEFQYHSGTVMKYVPLNQIIKLLNAQLNRHFDKPDHIQQETTNQSWRHQSFELNQSNPSEQQVGHFTKHHFPTTVHVMLLSNQHTNIQCHHHGYLQLMLATFQKYPRQRTTSPAGSQ